MGILKEIALFNKFMNLGANEERRIRQIERQLRQDKLDRKQANICNFLEGLEINIPHSQKQGLVEFMMNLPEDAVDFSEGTQTRLEWMKDFLSNLPQILSSRTSYEEFSEECRDAYAESAKAYAEAWRQ